jgi:hypothetical protein
MVNLNSSMYYFKVFFKHIFYTRDGPLQKAWLVQYFAVGCCIWDLNLWAIVNQQHAIGYDSIVDEPQLSRHWVSPW